MHHCPSRSSVDSVPAAEPVGDEQHLGGCLSNGGKQRSLGHRLAHRVGLRLVAEGARPFRSSWIPRSPAPVQGRASASPAPPASARRPSGDNGRGAGPGACCRQESGAGTSPRTVRGAPTPRRASMPRASRVASGPGSTDSNSSRSVRRQEGSTPTMGTARSRNGRRVRSVSSISARASSTSPAERNVRPQQSGRRVADGRCTRYPARSMTRSALRATSGSNQAVKVSTRSTTSGASATTVAGLTLEVETAGSSTSAARAEH